jgi:hypothetical protein
MKFPRVILETRVSPADKAAIMGGNVSTARQEPGVKIRIVQTGERNLLPILTVEQEGKPDAMGVMQWTPIELPWQVLMALYVRQMNAAPRGFTKPDAPADPQPATFDCRGEGACGTGLGHDHPIGNCD